jgi:hypothetical protein
MVLTVDTLTSATMSAKSENFDVASTTIASTPPGAVYRMMEREERDRHDVENWWHAQYKADYDHPEGPVPNLDRQPRY